MIFNWFIKHILLIRRFMWLFVLECTSLKWILEFEIERLKLSSVLKKISAWSSPLKPSYRRSIGLLEVLENTKISAFVFLIKESLSHATRYICTFVLLTICSNSTYKQNLLYTVFRFFKITLYYASNTSAWSKYHSNCLSVHNFNNKTARDKLSILGFNSSWVHRNSKIQNTGVLLSAILVDSKLTLMGFINIYCCIAYKNAFNSIKNMYKYIQFIYVLAICLFTLELFQLFFYFNLFKNSWLVVGIVILLYLVISTYFHFSKTYQYIKYTSQTQRFWKRTFGIFWGLELTLFFIYLYFTLVSPAELPMYSANYKEITTGLSIAKLSNYHLLYFFLLVLLSFFYINLIILKKRNSFHFFNIILLLVNLLYCYILYYEFTKIYYAAGWGTNSVYSSVKSFTTLFEYNSIFDNNSSDFKNLMYFKVPNTLINNWTDVQYEKQWVRTFRHFLYIIVILKFWHVLFIYIYFALSLVKFLETNYWSFDVLSSNYQNATYIIWFYIFSYVLIVKKKLYFLITFIYFWSYVQLNFTNVVLSAINELNLLYLL